jgi:hypothetical protein
MSFIAGLIIGSIVTLFALALVSGGKCNKNEYFRHKIIDEEAEKCKPQNSKNIKC